MVVKIRLAGVVGCEFFRIIFGGVWLYLSCFGRRPMLNSVKVVNKKWGLIVWFIGFW